MANKDGFLSKIGGVSGAVGMVGGLAQLGFGIADRIKGKRKLKEAQSFYEQNKYAIPEAARAGLGVAERQAAGLRLPGEDIRRAQMQEAVAGGVGAAQQAATSASDVQATLANLYGQQITGEQNLGIEGARRYDINQQQLQQSLGMMAGYEDIEWQQNVLAPYQQMLGQAEALQSRGGQGMGAGFGGLGGTGAGIMQQQGAQKRYDQWLQQQVGTQLSPYGQNVVDRRFLGQQTGTPLPINAPRTELLPFVNPNR